MGGEAEHFVSKAFEDEATQEEFPQDWVPFSDTPKNPILPTLSFQPGNFNLFSDDWFDVEENAGIQWHCYFMLGLAVLLLWYAFTR